MDRKPVESLLLSLKQEDDAEDELLDSQPDGGANPTGISLYCFNLFPGSIALKSFVSNVSELLRYTHEREKKRRHPSVFCSDTLAPCLK